jgi:c-di-GMP-related signal transduction protein
MSGRGCADDFSMATPSAGHIPSAKPRPGPGARFVARQVILTRDEKVFGYELLFRDGIEDYFCSPDMEAASRSTLDSSMLMGLDVLCDGQRAFINCTREVLLKEYVTLLPAQQTVVEILETVPADDLVVAACRRLKESSYMIALDDFVLDDPRSTLAELADIIKVDIRVTTASQRAQVIKRHGAWRCRMLAEKVETRDEFLETSKSGFVYFQGYFFRHPELMTAKEIPVNRLNYLRMLQMVSQDELNHREIEKVLKSEASLCYRLLRYLNSAAFSFSNEVHSVRHALSLLGDREVRRWVRLVATLGASEGKPSDLLLTALVRARFCELLSPRIQNPNSDLFLLGLLSLMDAILEMPMEKVLESIAVDHETKAVLLGAPSPLRPLYQLMLSQESGEWRRASDLTKQLHLSESDVAENQWKAMQWARQVNSG